VEWTQKLWNSCTLHGASREVASVRTPGRAVRRIPSRSCLRSPCGRRAGHSSDLFDFMLQTGLHKSYNVGAGRQEEDRICKPFQAISTCVLHGPSPAIIVAEGETLKWETCLE
jgi:hypothetical protein